ncbi:unnamed protein product [Prunus armeniaca]|uniref:Uncharacterized protein n=1 Tax=Prunus armeniaca TaxID=36596 RepID=A0A6J5XM08_PRUAR|nr:unnamed protein product [Prunus armeniaca]
MRLEVLIMRQSSVTSYDGELGDDGSQGAHQVAANINAKVTSYAGELGDNDNEQLDLFKRLRG